MKQYRLKDLGDVKDGHFLRNILKGAYLCQGGVSYKKPNQRTHDKGCTCPACDGQGHHVHADDSEVFVVLQGRGIMQVNGVDHPLTTGDVVVCEPGDDHHLVADPDDPCVNLWLHAGPNRHPDQDLAT